MEFSYHKREEKSVVQISFVKEYPLLLDDVWQTGPSDSFFFPFLFFFPHEWTLGTLFKHIQNLHDSNFMLYNITYNTKHYVITLLSCAIGNRK